MYKLQVRELRTAQSSSPLDSMQQNFAGAKVQVQARALACLAQRSDHPAWSSDRTSWELWRMVDTRAGSDILSRLRPCTDQLLRDGQVDRDLLLFRQSTLALAQREMGTPDADDGVVERCCPTAAALMSTWIRFSPPELTASI